MLDQRFVRSQPDRVRQGLAARFADIDLDAWLADDEAWRRLLTEVESMRARRNTVSEEIGQRKRQGQDAEDLIAQMRDLNAELKDKEEQLAELESSLQRRLLHMPNLPHPSVPVGPDETANEEVRRWGEPPVFAFEPKAHWDLGSSLKLFNAEQAAAMSGARFVVLTGQGAQLERALINFMLDLHTTEHGYEEVLLPHLVTSEALEGTAQLPHLADDMFRMEDRDLWLIPTAEVPLGNLHRDEILAGDTVPRKYVAYTPCYRAEAGAHGRDTRGLIRLHQFHKVELFQFVAPAESYDVLEALLGHAEEVLRRLELPYRVVTLSSGDAAFQSAKTYDIEVWLPSYDRYREISSCSNCEAFQARRTNTRYRPAPDASPEFVHTLNGSGLAVDRCLAAIVENCQEGDGRVRIPDALQPYMGGRSYLGDDF